MENLWVQISTIFIAGVTGIWKGVPIGFAMHANPFITGSFTALGSIALVIVLLVSGEPFKQWILGLYGQNKLRKKQGKFSRIMDRYGVAGIGLIGCGLIGPLLSTLLGLVLVDNPKRLIAFLISGILLWTGLLTLIASLGIDVVQNIINL
jgi:hypothetical protein